MIDSKPQQIDKHTWNKVSFYIDILIFIIIAVSVYILIIYSYKAGQASVLSGAGELTNNMLYVAAAVAFLSVGLTWIFFRLYSYRGQLARRHW